MKYRKKPVVIEAVIWDGSNGGEIADFMHVGVVWIDNGVSESPKLKIETLEGTMYASVGDYVIKGVNGEFYPCKPDIFEKTYELVEQEE